MVKPANNDVNVSRVVTIVASRYTLCSNRLKDAYIIKLPKQTANEKKHCVIALYQTCNEYKFNAMNAIKYIPFANFFFQLTFASNNFSHCGRRKNAIPFHAPGNVMARINKMNKTTYGNRADRETTTTTKKAQIIREIYFKKVKCLC